MLTVLFDLGGVLCSDPWETICLTPVVGLADSLGLPRSLVEAAGLALWDRFSLAPTEEWLYWQDFSAAVGVQFPRDLITAVAGRTLQINPFAHRLLDVAKVATRGRVGILSDNTTFFYARQSKQLELNSWVDPTLRFLSCELGVGKGSKNRGLLEVAAEVLSPEEVVFVDDRPHNIQRAHNLGFRAIHLSSWLEGEIEQVEITIRAELRSKPRLK
ncbi:HAD family hydrolase [Kineococcus sp. GCM10028916]|uniref:HAD family hydrolase n=1 Tax=Kineococcus sp. GCM10028916 TaxID=3273394 RepID=UPI0036458CAA